MRIGRLRHYIRPLLFVGLLTLGSAGTAFAQTSSQSPTYQITETQFGASSLEQNCSGQYCAKASIGDMSGGSSTAGEGTAIFEPLEGTEPRLEVIVEPGESNLGTLTTESTATKTTIVRVKNYLGEGYTLHVEGNPPKFKNHTLATPSTPAASTPGTEQFGLNVVANTLPSVGADPQQIPADQGIFGKATDNYKTANLFKYTSGEVIARSDAESGRTDYTISMIVNISNSTPAGHFSGDFSAVVVPAY